MCLAHSPLFKCTCSIYTQPTTHTHKHIYIEFGFSWHGIAQFEWKANANKLLSGFGVIVNHISISVRVLTSLYKCLVYNSIHWTMIWMNENALRQLHLANNYNKHKCVIQSNAFSGYAKEATWRVSFECLLCIWWLSFHSFKWPKCLCMKFDHKNVC